MVTRRALALALLAAACAEPEQGPPVVEAGITGVELTVHFAESAALEQLSITGTVAGAEAFEPGLVPDPPRALAPEGETLAILLPPELAGSILRIRVDGLRDGVAVAAEAGEVPLVAGVLVPLQLSLGDPATCGDGVVREGLEGCDDGGTTPGDGCDAACAVEPSYTCAGEPSVCVRCGNGLVEGIEACDDGGVAGGDGCSATCHVEAGYTCAGEPSTCSQTCGDGVLDERDGCDDGNVASGDGCSAACVVEPGFSCEGAPSRCAALCGDGFVRGDEGCDDGAAADGDGCSSLCAEEQGFACAGEPSTCGALCGDGLVRGEEWCDDGGTSPDDGCSASCGIEPGYSCTGSPSVCLPGCGDGTTGAGEGCDDENLMPGDGCSAACTVEKGFVCTGAPSRCTPLCGDGLLLGEACDDGRKVDGDGCSASCEVEEGYACAGEPSTCGAVCGDGLVRGDEGCDDGGTAAGDGCDAGCAVEPGFSCGGEPSDCGPCGDGVVDAAEGCDDGNVGDGDGCDATCAIEPGFTCGAEPSICSRCGDGVAAGMEVCDGADVGGRTCLELGLRRGAGPGLGCAAGCGALDTAGCTGGPIDTVEQLRAAIAEAHAQAGHETIAIHAGTFVLEPPLVLDECGGAACASAPEGVTLQPLEGAIVELTGAVAIEVVTGGNGLLGLTFRDCGVAVDLLAGADAGTNLVRGGLFLNAAVPSVAVVRVASDGNYVLANRLASDAAGPAGDGIVVTGEGTTVAMNVVAGSYARALVLEGFGAGGASFVDHNSIWLRPGVASLGVRMSAVTGLCYRNNVVAGHPASTGLEASGVSLGAAASCGGFASRENANVGSGTSCSGNSCNLCRNGQRRLCDRAESPGFVADDLCLAPAGNALVDGAVDVGRDLVDGDPARFLGAAPDVGARESGSTRSYGGVASTCP